MARCPLVAAASGIDLSAPAGFLADAGVYLMPARATPEPPGWPKDHQPQ
ncbi:MAG TPA: hypothetical protein VGM60_07400 [Pseudonocardia sp.]